MQSKSKKITSIATISLFIISMFLATVPLALAQPKLTLSPTSGPPGTIVTISGSGFTAGTYRVYFDNDGDASYNSGEPYKTVTVGAPGTFTTTLMVPTVPSGTYYIRADVYPYTPPAIASAPFTVKTLWDQLWDKLLAIESEISAIEAKLDDETRWVSDADLASAISTITSAIGSAKSEILKAISNAQSAIIAEINANEGKIDAIEAKLEEGGSFYTFVDNWFKDIKNEVEAIEDKLDEGGQFYTFVNTWFGLIEGKLDKLVADPELMLRPEGHVIEEYSNVAHSGHWSIEFLIPEGHGQSSGHYDNLGFTNTEAIEDGQRIILLGHGLSTLNDFNSLSFWYYFPYQAQLTHPTAPPNTVNEWNILPYVGIFIDSDNDGDADRLLMSMTVQPGVTDAWTQHTIPDNWWAVFGTDENGKAYANTLAHWKSKYGTETILEIRLYWGYWAGTYAINDNIVYVDDIVINGIVTYDCERPVMAP